MDKRQGGDKVARRLSNYLPLFYSVKYPIPDNILLIFE